MNIKYNIQFENDLWKWYVFGFYSIRCFLYSGQLKNEEYNLNR